MEKLNKIIFKIVMILIILAFFESVFLNIYGTQEQANNNSGNSNNSSQTDNDDEDDDNQELETSDPENEYTKRYTIESIIFNEVPIFDINFFNVGKAGGEDVVPGSPVAIIRNGIASWYISFRNLASIALIILIVYYGIRMAISTVAEEQAKFKEFLLNWLKSLLLLWTLDIIMMMVLGINDDLVEIFKNTMKNKENGQTMDSTIRTRARSNNPAISLPATIMYLALVIIWIRFIFAYARRMLNAMIQTILAPLIIVRYAWEGAKGKESDDFRVWLKDYISNVWIQAAHALTYTVFMSIALETVTKNVYGFIIALIFMHYILKMDDIVLELFDFGNVKNGRNLKEPPPRPKDLINTISEVYFPSAIIGGMFTSGGGAVRKSS